MKLPAMIAYVILRVIFAPVFLVADLLTNGWVVASDDFIAMRISLGDSPVVDLYHWQFMLAWLLLCVIVWAFRPVRNGKEFTDLIDGDGIDF